MSWLVTTHVNFVPMHFVFHLTFLFFQKIFTAWKVSKCGVFSVFYFSLVSPNAGKYGPEKILYLETFRPMIIGLCFMFNVFANVSFFFWPMYHHKLTTPMVECHICLQSLNCDVRTTYNFGQMNRLIFLHGNEWIDSCALWFMLQVNIIQT